ncbi:MAG: filamentous hemagglutinin N-terminal domain-containing protein [Betaproteobacteria bacterium]|nr:MAG: filamentous hemagglutinin N-terminal domain-containing protein [Betaproteobacteria bacterium]
MSFPFAAGTKFAQGMKSIGGVAMSSSSAKRRQRGDFKPKLIALSVAACFSLSNGQSFANPTGGTVGSGSATFASSGNTLTITNSANAIINWQSFSIGVNEITQFLQSSGSSAVLNRVVGANGVIPQSVIDGILSSNGRVFLINPSGVVIGSTGRIDVAGFVASSLNLSDQDFLNGRLSNAGVIDTSSGGAGGRVFLVGPDVQNSGLIRSPQGQIVLAAGKSVELVSENSPFVTVRVVADTEQALNVGQLISDSGRIGMFGALVRQGGVVEANSAVVGANGEIRLVATKDLTHQPHLRNRRSKGQLRPGRNDPGARRARRSHRPRCDRRIGRRGWRNGSRRRRRARRQSRRSERAADRDRFGRNHPRRCGYYRRRRPGDRMVGRVHQVFRQHLRARRLAERQRRFRRDFGQGAAGIRYSGHERAEGQRRRVAARSD